ncbi:hypothetical protein ElyMa_005236500 [Elysia marginata]|uniref:Uncharacterized protein n=1 Tax=Elysia marginata TaxID=1093978 RepID=A0AAV4JXJ8_9GAST|nr:hypothetical protein ElyMa_005236500 [Elysia marginata]
MKNISNNSNSNNTDNNNMGETRGASKLWQVLSLEIFQAWEEEKQQSGSSSNNNNNNNNNNNIPDLMGGPCSGQAMDVSSADQPVLTVLL